MCARIRGAASAGSPAGRSSDDAMPDVPPEFWPLIAAGALIYLVAAIVLIGRR